VRVLYFADTRFPIERANGVQTMETCHALAARGHEVKLVIRPDTVRPPRDPFAFYGLAPLPGLTIDPVDAPKTVRVRRVQFLLAAVRRLLRAEADVALTRDLGVAAFLLRLPAGRRPPIVYESHGLSPVVSAEMAQLLGKPELEPSARKLQRLEGRERRVWRTADAYVTITRTLADELTSRYGPRERVFVVPDGARTGSDLELPVAGHGDPATGNSRSDPIAAYAGHLYPWKGVDVFLQALARTPEVRGLVVGGHPGEADFGRVEALARELKLQGRVTLTGLVAPTEVRPHLAPATMLVLPNTRSAISERYTSPLKLFEYLAMGRAIVASDLPAIREVLTDGVSALLVPPGDPQLLADALSRLARDAELAGRLAEAAAALAPEYTWSRRAERLEAAFAAATAPSSASGASSRERRGDHGVPASERVGGSAGAKPPGQGRQRR
jgi:glycosyltransferase involved in cell wall biosynthesis